MEVRLGIHSTTVQQDVNKVGANGALGGEKHPEGQTEGENETSREN